MSILVGFAGFFVFSVLWVAGTLWHATAQHKAVGLAVMFSPLFWTLGVIAALGSIYLSRR